MEPIEERDNRDDVEFDGKIHFLQTEGNHEATLWLKHGVCPPELADRVIAHILDQAHKDEEHYNKAYQCHKYRQPAVWHGGKGMEYRSEKFADSPIPEVFLELKALAEQESGVKFDIIYVKIMEPGDRLARHQDLRDPKTQKVAEDLIVVCFTFTTDPTQECELRFYKGTTSTKVRASIKAPNCSMWFMGGNTNSTHSHTVIQNEGNPGGHRFTATFRQSEKTRGEAAARVEEVKEAGGDDPPIAAEPEPIAAEPEPAAAEPEPVAAEDVSDDVLATLTYATIMKMTDGKRQAIYTGLFNEEPGRTSRKTAGISPNGKKGIWRIGPSNFDECSNTSGTAIKVALDAAKTRLQEAQYAEDHKALKTGLSALFGDLLTISKVEGPTVTLNIKDPGCITALTDRGRLLEEDEEKITPPESEEEKDDNN